MGATCLVDRKKIVKPYSSGLVVVHYIVKKQVVVFQKSKRKGNPSIIVRFKENLHGPFVYDFLCDQFCVDVYVTARVRRCCTAGCR